MVTNVPTGPRLIGIGVGPGDPDLLTMKAVAAFRDADVILVPATERSGDGAGRAEQVVVGACPEADSKIERVPFSMADRRGVSERRREAWELSASAALAAYARGARTVCFATVGDPSVYSTFSYLADHVARELPGLEVEVVPGITAMQALAAASRIPLVEGTEVLALVPVTHDLGPLDRALACADTVVAYKGGRQLREVVQHVRNAPGERAAVMGVNVSLPEQILVDLDEVADDESAPYFSAVLSAPKRTVTGGRL